MIQLISQRPNCIFGALDEASAIDRTDKQMLQQFHTQFATRKSYRKPMRASEESFAINHYAGQARRVGRARVVGTHRLACTGNALGSRAGH